MKKLLPIGLMILSFNSFSQFTAVSTEVSSIDNFEKIISENADNYKVNIYEDNIALSATIVISKYFGKELSLATVEAVDYTNYPKKIEYHTKGKDGFKYDVVLVEAKYQSHKMRIYDYNRKKSVLISLYH
jgi:hypothetical protein